MKSLGDRMKGYENISRKFLTRRIPVIIRLDGKAFHTFTKGMKKPFDDILMESMWETAKYLSENIQGCKVAYTQSDEISLLLTDYENIDTDAWFGNNIQKMASISSSMATLSFNKNFREKVQLLSNIAKTEDEINYFNRLESKIDTAMFDSRVFSIPKEDIVNYFIWRQKDAITNSIQMVGQSEFSHKELNKISCEGIKSILLDKGVNWDSLPTYQKRGVCVSKDMYILNDDKDTIRNRWAIYKEVPVFTKDRDYIERFI